MTEDEPERSPAAQQDPPADPPASPTSLPPMPPQPFPGTFPPPPGLDEILRAASSPGALGPPLHRARRPPPMTTERYDERCWTTTRQTNARRALGREPTVTMYCYLNMRHALENLIPVPGHPTAFLARDDPLDEHVPVKPLAERPEGTPEYHWPWLDGRFIYVARGRENVARHMREMGGVSVDGDARKKDDSEDTVEEKGPMAGRVKRKLMPAAADEDRISAWETIRRIEDRVEKQKAEKLLPAKRDEVILRRAMGFEDDSSESLISLSDAYSNSLQRLHAHIVRIYSPGLKNLARLPEIWTDGTQAQMFETVTTRLTDGSAFALVGRLWDSLGNVHGQLEERRKRRGGGDGEAGPFGGMQPPAPPLPPPPPSAGAARSATPAGDTRASTEEGQDGAPDAPSPPRGRPVVTRVSCSSSLHRGKEVAADATDKIDEEEGDEEDDEEEEEEDEDADQATTANRPVYPLIDPRTPNSRAVLMSSDGDPLASYLCQKSSVQASNMSSEHSTAASDGAHAARKPGPAEERAAARPLADEDEPLSDVFLSSTVSTLPLATSSKRSAHDSAKAEEADEERDYNEGQEDKSNSAPGRRPVYPVLADPSNPNSMGWAISFDGGFLVCGLSPEEQHAEWVKEQETERIQQEKEKQAAEARGTSG